MNSTTKQLTTSNTDGGHCCENGQRWRAEGCVPSDYSLCTKPFQLPLTQYITLYSGQGPINTQKTQYCAMINKGVNTGIWENITSY